MPALNVGVNSTFEQQRQIVNSIAVDLFTLSTTLSGLTTDGLVVTYASSSGIATVANYAVVAGIATYATRTGIATYATVAGIATYASIAGVASALNFVPNYSHNSGVASYAPVAGYSTVSNFANSASSSTFAFYAGISTYSGTAGISTVAQGLTGTPNVQVGVITATLFVGDGSELSNITVGISSYSSLSGFATVAGISSYSSLSGFATVAGISSYSTLAGVATYASSAGVSTFATSSGSASVANYAAVAGFATVAGNLTGTPNIIVGVLTATKFAASDAEFVGIVTAQSLKSISGFLLSPDNQQSIRIFSGSGSVSFPLGIGSDINVAGIITGTKLYGDASNVTGIVTAGISSIVAGGNIIVQQTGNVAIVTAVLAGGGGGFFEGGTAGIGTTSAVGIGTTIPSEKLTVKGNVSVTGNIILTGELSSPTRIKFGSGGENIKIGSLSGGHGAANIAIGDQALVTNNGGTGHNIGIGQLSLFAVTSGQYNIAVGDRAGQNLTTGSNNVIIGGYNGQNDLDLRTSSNNVVLSDGVGNIRQYINSSGDVGIKTTIVTEALTVAGVVSATSFYGTLNASQLTGSLPAIDGSALTGVTAVGSGVEIRKNNTPLGVAATINFGSNINITLSSGIATVTGVTSVTNATTAYALAGTPNLNVGIVTAARLVSSGASLTSPLIVGITTATYGIRFASDPGASQYVHNIGPWYIIGYDTAAGYQNDAYLQFSPINSNYIIRNVGIGTTNPTSKLTVSGDGKFTGVVTATSFFGSGANLVDIDATQLTGSLPAIDGSQLLNVTAAGTGIAIRSNDTLVGSAVTVNFGTGLGVTFSSGIATITSTGGSLQSRTTVSGVTTSIPNLGIGNTDITGFKAYSLMRVGLSTAGWIRLYTDSTSRANDVTRSVGEDPAPGSGVIAEIVTTGISTQQMITPFAMGGNMDNPVTNKIYVAITNLSGTTQTITANLTILQLEA